MKTLGDYTLVRKLGEGGMGEVWLGRRPTVTGVAKLVAIKLLAKRHAESDRLIEMFLQEARLSMLLTHSNIVQVFDVIEVDEVCFMVMEFVDGLDLARLSAKLRTTGARLSHTQVAFIIAKLLRALAYAHELDHRGEKGTIIHRDISPQNVMLSVTGEIKLMDFGIARLSSDETSGAQVRGKPRYMPPEQLAGKTRAPTVDLFAVGAILHELLDGQKFRSQAVDDGELYGMIIAGRFPPLEARGVPAPLEALRAGLLEAKVEDRIPSARAALKQLSAWDGLRDASFELESLLREFVDRTKLPDSPIPVRASSRPPSVPSGDTIGSRVAVQDLSATELAFESAPLDSATGGLELAGFTESGESGKAVNPAPESDSEVTATEEPLKASGRFEAMARATAQGSKSSGARFRPSQTPMWLRVIGLSMVGVWGVLVLYTFISGRSESPVKVEAIDWSPCVEEPETKSCADVCAEYGGRCMPYGCPGEADACLPWTCDTATQLQGLGRAVCTDTAFGSHIASSCEAPIELGMNDSTRCCCEGMSEQF